LAAVRHDLRGLLRPVKLVDLRIVLAELGDEDGIEA